MALTTLWTIIVIVHIGGGLNWPRYLGRWLDADLIFFPTAAAAGAHLEHLAVAGVISAALIGIGSLALRASRFGPADILEEIVLGYALGYGIVATLGLALGLAGLWAPNAIRAWSVSAVLLGAIGVGFAMRPRPAAANASPEKRASKALASVAISGVMIVCLLTLRYALIPETFYDALVYHLALPAEYLLKGRIFPTPSNSLAGVPALPQMVSAIALAWDSSGVSPGLIHWSMIPWCCAALAALARRLKRPGAGMTAMALFAATPVCIGEAFRVSVGLEWTLFQLCCLLACLSLSEDVSGSRIGRALVAGSLLGFTMSTKYLAWLVPIALVALLAASRRQAAEDVGATWGVKEVSVAASAAAIVLAPWIIKNVAFYRNPIYPFLHEKFVSDPSTAPGWRQIGEAGPGSVSEWLLHPWRFLKPPNDVTGTVGPGYFALLPALLLAPLGRQGRVLAIFVVAAWLPLSAFSLETRFFIPHLAVLALLLAYLIEGLGEREASLSRGAAFALSALTAFGWIVMDSNREKLPVFSGQKGASAYLEHSAVSYPTPPFAAYEYLNDNTPSDTRVLVYGEARGYYLNRDAVISSPDQASDLERWADEAPDEQHLAERLRGERVSYVVANLAEISRLHRQPKVSDHGMIVLDGFWRRYTQRVFGAMDPRDRWVGVYKVLSEEEARRPHDVDDLFASYRKKAA